MSTKDKAKQNIRIFLGYASEDSNRATELMNELAKQPNVDVFTSDKMSAGENRRTKIKKSTFRKRLLPSLALAHFGTLQMDPV